MIPKVGPYYLAVNGKVASYGEAYVNTYVVQFKDFPEGPLMHWWAIDGMYSDYDQSSFAQGHVDEWVKEWQVTFKEISEDQAKCLIDLWSKTT